MSKITTNYMTCKAVRSGITNSDRYVDHLTSFEKCSSHQDAFTFL